MMDYDCQAINENPCHYKKAFEVFTATYERYKIYDKWMDRFFSYAVVTKLGQMPTDPEGLRVLGVGSGTGEIDCEMLKHLLVGYKRIFNRVVEPKKEHLVQYEKLASFKATELHGVRFDWRQQTIEEYEDSGDAMRFRFISVIHSSYHMKDLRHSMMYMYDLLEPDGVLLVMNKSGDSGVCRFRRRFKSFCHEHVSSADICSVFDGEGLPYALYGIPMRADISECFQEESETGNLLLDFLVQTVAFRESAPEELRAQVLDYLGSKDCSQKIDGKTYLNIDNEAIVIKKPASA